MFKFVPKFTIITIAVLLAATFVASPWQQASALSGNNFNAGHIIDDYIFTDANAMSVQSIQNFLNAKVGSCDNNGTGSAAPFNSGMTRTAYDASIGKNTKFTCINQYVENPTTHANNLDGNATPSGGETAAQIIYNAAQQYQINPQVILATIQKEQGLVTDTWPWDSEYTLATGYACPDSADVCNSEYYGFYNQITSAAWQFHQYMINPNHYNYVVGTDSILWSPVSGCGGANVNIQNQATAALYDYTPYQPNSGALSNVTDASTGGSDGGTCGSYGNRNFWWFFNEWFGSSLVPSYYWQWAGQNVYTDNSMTTPADSSNLIAGNRYYFVLHAQNDGTATWQKGTANLGTFNPTNRSSALYDSSWLSASRAATLTEQSVAPGATGTFGFWVTAPKAGTYREYFDPVADGLAWMNDLGLYWQITTVPRQYTYQWVGQAAYTDDTLSTPADLMSAVPGQRYYLKVSIKNTGNVPWQKGVTNLGTDGPENRYSAFYDPTWLSPSRPATIDQDTVNPGDTGSFSFWVTAPINQGGLLREYFNPVEEYVTWMNDIGMQWQFSLPKPSYTWQWAGQGAYTDSSMNTPVDPANLAPNTRYYLAVHAQNTGNVIWKRNTLNLGTTGPQNRISRVYDSSWLSPSRPATIDQDTAPSQTATFGFWIKTSSVTGTYNEYFDPVADGITWLPDYGLYWSLVVK